MPSLYLTDRQLNLLTMTVTRSLALLYRTDVGPICEVLGVATDEESVDKAFTDLEAIQKKLHGAQFQSGFTAST